MGSQQSVAVLRRGVCEMLLHRSHSGPQRRVRNREIRCAGAPLPPLRRAACVPAGSPTELFAIEVFLDPPAVSPYSGGLCGTPALPPPQGRSAVPPITREVSLSRASRPRSRLSEATLRMHRGAMDGQCPQVWCTGVAAVCPALGQTERVLHRRVGRPGLFKEPHSKVSEAATTRALDRSAVRQGSSLSGGRFLKQEPTSTRRQGMACDRAAWLIGAVASGWAPAPASCSRSVGFPHENAFVCVCVCLLATVLLASFSKGL